MDWVSTPQLRMISGMCECTMVQTMDHVTVHVYTHHCTTFHHIHFLIDIRLPDEDVNIGLWIIGFLLLNLCCKLGF